MLQSLDRRVKQIHDAVPSQSLMMVILGCSDLSLVKRQVILFFFYYGPCEIRVATMDYSWPFMMYVVITWINDVFGGRFFGMMNSSCFVGSDPQTCVSQRFCRLCNCSKACVAIGSQVLLLLRIRAWSAKTRLLEYCNRFIEQVTTYFSVVWARLQSAKPVSNLV